MRLLVYDKSSFVRDSFIISLLPKGFEVITVKEKKDILTTCAKLPFNVAVIEVSPDDEETMFIIKTFNTDEAYSNISVIVNVLDPTKEFMLELLKIGVAGYLIKPFNDKDLYERLSNILTNAKIDISKLKMVNIMPEDNDNVDIKFRSSITNKVVKVTILELSAVSVKFKFQESVSSEIQLKQLIDNVQIQIGSSRVVTPAFVTCKKDDIATVTFHNITPFDLNKVCKYVYDANLRKYFGKDTEIAK